MFSLTDLLTLFGFALTALGLFFTAFQLRQNAKVQRASFLLEMTERYFQDEDVRKLFYAIDYGEGLFDESKPVVFSGNSREERLLDELLYRFDLIGYLVKKRAFSTRETSIFTFQAARVLDNTRVMEYLAWLDTQYAKYGRFLHDHQGDKSQIAHQYARYLTKILQTQKRVGENK